MTTNWDEFFAWDRNTTRPMQEGAYKEALRRAAAAKAGGVVDEIAEAYARQYEAYSKTSAKTRTAAKRRAGR